MAEAMDGSTTERGYVVHGRVQGVGFRWWTQREAERLDVVGTVRNLPDGSVEVMARGGVDALERLERSLRRGPPMAQVERLEEVPSRLPAPLVAFSIAP